MKSIVFKNGRTRVSTRPRPVIDGEMDVLIQVSLTGICKTDIYVSEGKMGSKNDIVLGHEFSGYVVESGNDAFKPGDFVACHPVFEDLRMLGVDFDGSFSELIKVPASSCYKFDESVPKLAAYIEPIAASMAPLNLDCVRNPENKGVIIGKGRIPKLTETVLQRAGCNVSSQEEITSGSYDYVIETAAEESLLDAALDFLKPGGCLILKSRSPSKVPLDLYKIVRKEIKLEGCYYYDFAKTVEFAIQNKDLFEHLLGDVYNLEDWKVAFEASLNADRKIFLRPS